MALDDQAQPLLSSSTSSGGARTRARSPRPSTQETSCRESAYSVSNTTPSLVLLDLARVAEVALDQPGHALRDPDARGARGVAELPVGAAGVLARVELLRAGEVVLGLGGVAHLAANARDAEDAHVVALVRVADQVELPALPEQVVGVDLALLLGVAADRVVVEHDRLAAEDRGLDLRQPL